MLRKNIFLVTSKKNKPSLLVIRHVFVVKMNEYDVNMHGKCHVICSKYTFFASNLLTRLWRGIWWRYLLFVYQYHSHSFMTQCWSSLCCVGYVFDFAELSMPSYDFKYLWWLRHGCYVITNLTLLSRFANYNCHTRLT